VEDPLGRCVGVLSLFVTLHHSFDAALRTTTAPRAVFGAARRWFQTPNRIPAEEMATRIEPTMSPVPFGRVATLIAATHRDCGRWPSKGRFAKTFTIV
jgi:hypothetical protein